MSRRACNLDANQPAIVAFLSWLGAHVVPTSAVHDGFPDLLVAFLGETFLLEVKNPAKSPAMRALTPAQRDWHEAWKRGGGRPVAVVHGEVEAAMALGMTRPGAQKAFADYLARPRGRAVPEASA